MFCVNWQWSVRNIQSIYDEWRQRISWLWAPREEKVGLVKAQHPTAQTIPGLYSSHGDNGQHLINSDSDLRLDAQGAFTRFEAVDRDLHPPLGSGSAIIPPQPLRPAPQPRPTARPRPTPFNPPNPIEFLRLNDPTSAPLTPPPAPRTSGTSSNRGNQISMFTFQNNNYHHHHHQHQQQQQQQQQLQENLYSQFNRSIDEDKTLQFDTYTKPTIPENIQMTSYIYSSETKVPNFETSFERIESLENQMKDIYLGRINNRDNTFNLYNDIDDDGDDDDNNKTKYNIPTTTLHHDNNLNKDNLRYISSSFPGYEYTTKNHNQVRQYNKNYTIDIPDIKSTTTSQTIIDSLYAKKYNKNTKNYCNNIDWKNQLIQQKNNNDLFKNSSKSQEELSYHITDNFKEQGLQRVSQYIQSLPDLPIYDTIDDHCDDEHDDTKQTTYHDYFNNHQSNGNNDDKFSYNSVPPPAPPDPINHHLDIHTKNTPTTGERIFSALRSVSSQSYIDASEFYNSVLLSAQQVPKLTFSSMTETSLQLLNKSSLNHRQNENSDYYTESEIDIGMDVSKREGGYDLYSPELNLKAHRTAQEVYNSLQDPPSSPLLLKDMSQEPYPYMSDPSFTRTSEDIFNSLEQRRKSMERLNGFHEHGELEVMNEPARRKSSQDLYAALEEVQIMRRLSQSIEESYGSNYINSEINGCLSRRGSQGPEPEPPPDEGNLQKAISCESLSSDTSVILNDIDDETIVGHICIGFEFERWGGRSSADTETDLSVSILEARDLISPDGRPALDTLARVCLLPERQNRAQTRIYRGSSSPSYQEKYLFSLDGGSVGRVLLVEVFSFDVSFGGGVSLLGEASLKLGPAARPPATTWLPLISLNLPVPRLGELMISLSYLPTAERLTLVVVKARNLRGITDIPGDFFVKVYLLQQGKKMHKKKTSTKKNEKSPTFNEAMIFNIPAHSLQSMQLRLTVAEVTSNTKTSTVGHIIIGSSCAGKSLSHWKQMLASLRRPIVMWHPLRT
ncbi:uncharacterized protein LOC122859021 isoform X2 [Aphidius gifuensis]|uniref:uncharacterized protein LOC122859021 isoform X2 n=1 Tax=Aphidius gifuensis TaxID=684658 RepID=UPI001CDBA206|nr:uncharacterized protein LOC122859021 isoform X2 [Aphidius gifuensis]